MPSVAILIIFISLFNFTNLFSQINQITDLTAISGLSDIEEAKTKLTWTYLGADILPQGSTYWIYYSTYEIINNWDTEAYKIELPTGPVNPGNNEVYVVNFSTSFFVENNLSKDTTFYFKIKISSSEYSSELSNTATGWITLWPPYAELIDAQQGFYEGEIILLFKGKDDYGYQFETSLNGFWYIQYSSDEYFNQWSTNSAQIKISTHTYPSYQSNAVESITGLISGITYYFRLWAEDKWWNFSEISNALTTWAQVDISPPQKVSDISCSSGYKHVKLNWIIPYEDSYENGFVYNQGSFIGNIDIRYRNDQEILDESLWFSSTQCFFISGVELTPLTSTTTIITALTNGVSYYFSIKVSDEKNNWSAISSTSPFTKPKNTPVGCSNIDNHFSYDPVRQTISTLISSTTVILKWNEAGWSFGSDDFQYGDTFYYEIRISTYTLGNNLGATSYFLKIEDIEITSSTIYNLNEDTTYYWQLTAYDSETSSKTHILKFIINSENSPPNFPSQPLISPTTVWHTNNFKITFDWKDATDPDPGDYILGYKIFISSYENFSSSITIPQDGFITNSYYIMNSSIEPTNLLPYENKQLYWFVVAYDSATTLGYKQMYTQTSTASFWLNQKDELPYEFKITSPTIGTVFTQLPIKLQWEATSDPDPEDGIQEYGIFISSYSEEPHNLNDGLWRAETNPLGSPPYQIYFSSWDFFVSTEITKMIEEATAGGKDLKLIENATYWWCVRAIRPYNLDFGPPWNDSVLYSSVSYFRINFSSDPPFGYSVIKPTTSVNPQTLKGPVTFYWESAFDPDPLDYTTYYLLIVSSYLPNSIEEWFTIKLNQKATIWISTEFTSYTINFNDFNWEDMSPGATYYWQVFSWGKDEWEKAGNPSLDIEIAKEIKPYGISTTTGSFYISNQPPNEFLLYYPTGTVNIQTYNPTFYWQLSTDPDLYDPIISSYTLVISTSSNFQQEFTTFLWTSNTYYYLNFDFLKPRTTHFWYVIAYDKYDNSRQSSIEDFYLQNLPPYEFKLVSPINGDVIFSSQPIFQWEYQYDPDADELTFDIEISTYQNFYIKLSSGGFIFNNISSGSTVTINYPFFSPLEDNLLYYWRVKAKDPWQEETYSTSTFYVNYSSEPPNSFDIHTTSGIIKQKNIIFSWNSTTDPDPYDYVHSYKLCISTKEGYVVGVSTYTIIVDSNTISYIFDVSNLQENAEYCWWVEAYDKTGLFRKSSSSYNFIVDLTTEAPDDIELLWPTNENKFVRVSSYPQVEFIWSSANKTEWWKSLDYTIYLASTSNNIYSFSFSSGPYDNFYEAKDKKIYYSTFSLQENTTYFWWVEVKNSSGIKTSTTYYFFYDQTNDPPYGVNLSSPTNMSWVFSRKPKLEWTQAKDDDDDINRYEIIISSYSNFSSSITITVYHPQTYYTLDTKLAMLTTYYWKVIAYDTRDKGSSTYASQFYIPYFTPKPVKIISPESDEYRFNTRTPKIKWQHQGHQDENGIIEKYKIQISQNDIILYSTGTFQQTDLILDKIVATNYYQIETKLIQNITYYLKIIAIDDDNVEGYPTFNKFIISKIDIPQKVEIKKFDIDDYKIFISWTPVFTYTDGTLANDILGYNIYRSTNYEEVFNSLSKYDFKTSSINYFIDYFEDKSTTYYYIIKTVALGGIESAPCDEVITTYNKGSRIIYTQELKLTVPKNTYDEIKNLNAKINISTLNVSDIEFERLNMLSKYKISVIKEQKEIKYKFSEPIIFEINIEKTINSYSPSKKTSIQSLISQTNNYLKPTLFLYNNIEYIFVNTEYNINYINSKITTPAIYAVRIISLPTDIEIINIYPKKIFTPTATVDKKINFVLYNPTAYQPEGEVYDLNLRFVAKLKCENNVLSWDGKYESGEFVPKGIYIYKIKIKDKVFSGSIIVAK